MTDTAASVLAETEMLAAHRAGAPLRVAAMDHGVHLGRARELLRQAQHPGALPDLTPEQAGTLTPTTRADRFGTRWPARSEPLLALLDRYDLLGRARAVERLPLADVDLKASRHNQVRLETFVEHEVERYQTAWKDGAVFPPVLVRPLSNGRMFVLDGVHRTESASRAQVPAVPAVVVDGVDDELASILAIEANKENGIPLDLSSRLAHGVQWVLTRGYTVPRAAHILGLLPSRLEGEVKVAKAERRATVLRPRGWDTITTKSIKARLPALVNDSAFVGAVGLVVDADLKLGEVNDLVTELNRAGDHARQDELLARRREELADRIDRRTAVGRARRGPLAPRDRVLDGMDRLTRTLDEVPVEDVFTGLDRDTARERIAACRDRLDAALARLEAVG